MNPFTYRIYAGTLDFDHLDEHGRWVRGRVQLTAITGFGIHNDAHFTPEGGFSGFVPWGYLATAIRRYPVSLRLVRRWQREWLWELVHRVTLHGIRRHGEGTPHQAVNWEYRVLKLRRRGGAWPRKRRHAAPARRETRLILKPEDAEFLREWNKSKGVGGRLTQERQKKGAVSEKCGKPPLSEATPSGMSTPT